MENVKNKFILGSAAILMAGMQVAPAFAQDVVTTGNTIDTTKTGSITLYKLHSVDGKSVDGTGLEQAVTEQGIAGVKFNIVKVGDLAQIDTTEASGVQAGVYYTLSDDFKAQLAASGITITPSVSKDGTDYYTSEVVNAALKGVNNDSVAYDNSKDGSEAANEEFIEFAKAHGTAMAATDDTGKTSSNGLALGLYLVAEVESPADVNDGTTQSISKAARPFLISLPMTNIATISDEDGTNHEAGTVWQYDVTAYPKNEMINIRKDIIADGNDTEDGVASNGLVQSTNKNVGDYVNFLLTLDLPALQAKTNDKAEANALRKYIITDTMTKGLTLDDTTAANFKITFGTEMWNGNNGDLTYGDDYTVDLADAPEADGSRKFTITMTEAGLAKMSVITKDCKLFVNYKARLNADAVKTATGDIKVEGNKMSLLYGTSVSRDYEFKSNEDIKVYTYEIDVAKSFSKTVDDMSAVAFSIQGLKDDGSGDYEQIKFIKEADGVYHVYDGKEVTADSADILAEINCKADGKLILKGLDARMYVVTEESTVKGYNLMRDTITVNFDDDYLHDGKVNTAKLASGTYSDAKAIAITNADLDKGVVSFGIKNNETIEALHTGGAGWSKALMAVGTTAVLAGSAMFIFRRRKEDDEQ